MSQQSGQSPLGGGNKTIKLRIRNPGGANSAGTVSNQQFPGVGNLPSVAAPSGQIASNSHANGEVRNDVAFTRGNQLAPEDELEDDEIVQQSMRRSGAGRRTVIVSDDEEEGNKPPAKEDTAINLVSSSEEDVAGPVAKKSRLTSMSDLKAAQTQQQQITRGVSPAVKQEEQAFRQPSASPAPGSMTKQQLSRPPSASASTKAAASRSAPARNDGRRQRKAATRANRSLGEEEDVSDPDNLEAAAYDDDDDFEVDYDEDFSDEGNGRGKGRGGRGRGRGQGQGQGRGRRPNFGSMPLPEGDIGGDLQPSCLGQTDFTDLSLKADHNARPLWATPDGHIFLETFSPVYKQAQDFLVAIAEPVCRPEYVHEYQLTSHSLYAAVSVGLDTETIISVLSRLSKVQLDEELKKFIIAATKNYGKVKLVLKRNKHFIETSDEKVFNILKRDAVISTARVEGSDVTEKALKERAVASITRVQEADLATNPTTGNTNQPLVRPKAVLPAMAAATRGAVSAPGFFGNTDSAQPTGKLDNQGDGDNMDVGDEDPDETGKGGKLTIDDVEEGVEDAKYVRAFEIRSIEVENVKRRCLPGSGGLNYPMLEEYDFRNDKLTPDLTVELRPHVKLRPYQEKSLSKMFGNGRARSGIIVLPCGAGKSLVGVAAAARMRKSCLCLCTSSVSVDQWKHQFMLWTNLQDHQISRFTSDSKEQFAGAAGVTITTFTMVAYGGKRSEESEKVMEAIRNTEWGLLLMDEVHVVPAQMFRKVIGIVRSHCKLGLTATLVREDERIGDLNYLIGPKLYEANWLDLTKAGHIANVQCVEVWCPMTREFYKEYLKPENRDRRQLLYCMNPNKFMACQFLIDYHENIRKDKVIVFSDNIWALREYATRLGKPFIYGPTSHAERTRVLHAFKNDPNVNTVFLSKVGDNSLDIPEANVLIQISSHAGSRRQEAQRLGRILRAKRAKSGPATEFNAFFYTLVSQDTQEMYYSTKRQQFLIDQGYAFKVIPDLCETAQKASEPGKLVYQRRQEQLDLLCRIMVAGLEEAGVEEGAKDREEAELDTARKRIGGNNTAAGGVKRTAGDISRLTGAAQARYTEYLSEAQAPAGSAALQQLQRQAARQAARAKPSEKSQKMSKALGITQKK